MDIAILKWRKSQPQFIMQHEAIGYAKLFQSPCEKTFRQRCFQKFIRKFFIVVPLATQNAFIFRDSLIDVVGIVRLVRIQFFRFEKVLIVDVQFRIGKNLTQIVLYMSNERNWSLLLLFRRRFRLCFGHFFVLFIISLGVFSFATFDKFQFQSQVRLSQINIVVHICLKFKLYAAFIERGGRINFVFVGR